MKLPRWMRWRADREFEEEIETHLDLEVQANLDRGLSLDQARAAAARGFGNRTRVRERAREADPVFWLETFARDVLYGLRNLRRNPGFALVAALSLALGIGGNTLIFSLLDVTLLKSLAYPDANRLVAIWTAPVKNRDQIGSSSVDTYFSMRDRSHSFESVGAFNGGGCGVRSLGAERDGAPAERLFGTCVSPSLFGVLGVNPAMGRTFVDSEDRVENVAPVVLISHGLWQRRFGGDPQIVGKVVSLNQAPTTVIGVMAPDFRLVRDPNFQAGRSSELDFLAPLELTRTQVQSRVGGLTLVGRLKPGVSVQQAQAEIDAVSAQLAVSDPELHSGLAARVEPLQRVGSGSFRSPLLILQGAVGFVLLIGCANVAGLLLARTASRRHEVALRMTLGAGRLRVVRQLLAESLPLAVAGGVIGVLLAKEGLAMFAKFAPLDFPRLDQVSLDLRVLGFTTLVILATTVLFTIVPAMQASKVKLGEPLKETSRGSTGGAGRQRFRNVLVAGQIALALVLLIGAGLLIRSFVRVVESDVGADPRNLLTFDFRLPQSQTAKPFGRYRGMGLWEISPVPALTAERVLERLQTVPGVVALAAVNVQPFSQQTFPMPFQIEGRPLPPARGNSGEAQQTVNYFAVTRGYFGAMKIPLLAGRDFDAHDTAEALPVMIISQSMARQFFPNENPVGKHVTLDFSPGERPREIIGVVGDTVIGRLNRQQTPALYVSHLQQTRLVTGPWWYTRSGMYFVIRTSQPPLNLVPSLKRAVAEVDVNTPVADVKTADQILETEIRSMRLYMLLLGMFGIVAAVLAAIGIYGVTAYAVAARTREIGIRMAMGARSQDIFVMVLRQAGRVIAIGLALGLAGTFFLSRVIQSILFGLTATDPVTYATVSVLLLSIAVVACVIPTRRAAGVDPTTALKYE